MARDEFDWIDDAFDEGKASHAAPASAGRQAAGCIGAVVVLALVVGFVLVATFAGIGMLGAVVQR